jgi:hypothetical protein
MQRTTLSISSRAEIMITGEMAQVGIALELLEDLVAVHLRHQDVQEHEVERLRPQPLQRLRPFAAVKGV